MKATVASVDVERHLTVYGLDENGEEVSEEVTIPADGSSVTLKQWPTRIVVDGASAGNVGSIVVGRMVVLGKMVVLDGDR